MNEAKKEKCRKNLVEAGLMEETDTLIDLVQANYLEPLIGKMGQWKQGWTYFTGEKMIITYGLLGGNVIIPYKNIRRLGKCSQSMLPIGITITHEKEGGGTVTDRISLMKRQKWMDLLAEKAGISLS